MQSTMFSLLTANKFIASMMYFPLPEKKLLLFFGCQHNYIIRAEINLETLNRRGFFEYILNNYYALREIFGGGGA